MVKPASNKRVVEGLILAYKLSERLVCKLVGRVTTSLKELAVEYLRYGYMLLHGLPKREGLVQNKKRTYRLYTKQGLQARTKKRKKPKRRNVLLSDDRWT